MRDLRIGRLLPGGAAMGGTKHRWKRHVDDVEFASLDADAAGVASLTRDWSDGPYYHEVEKDGVKRVASSKVGGSVGPINLLELVRPLRAMGTGVVAGDMDGLAVTAPGGMKVRVGTGACVVDGIPTANYVADAADDLTVAANASGSTRIDRVVVRVHRAGTAEEGKSFPFLLAGTPGAGAPALKRDAATWDLALAQVTVVNGAAAISTGNVADDRTYLLTGSILRNPRVTGSARTFGNLSYSQLQNDIVPLNVSVVLVSGVVYDIVARSDVLVYAPGGFFVAQAPYIDGTANRAPDLGHTSTNFLNIPNGHTRTMTGAGAAVACGVLLTLTSGSGATTIGLSTLFVDAVPRS